MRLTPLCLVSSRARQALHVMLDRCSQQGAAIATTDAAIVGAVATAVRRGAETMRTRPTYTRTRELKRCGRGRLTRIPGRRRLNLYNLPLNLPKPSNPGLTPVTPLDPSQRSKGSRLTQTTLCTSSWLPPLDEIAV